MAKSDKSGSSTESISPVQSTPEQVTPEQSIPNQSTINTQQTQSTLTPSTGTVQQAQPQQVGLHNIDSKFDQVLEMASSRPRRQTEYIAAVASKQDIDNVIVKILVRKNLPVTEQNYASVLVSSAYLLQIGATSPKFATSRKISKFDVELSVGELKEACSGVGITPRKMARGIRDYILKVAYRYNLKGNLSKNYKLENPNCDRQDLIWASDFQTFSENPSMPDHVRVWLLENFRSRFRPNMRSNQYQNQNW